MFSRSEVFALILLILPSGCGRVGAIRPPEATAPAPVQFLVAEGQADGILLRWQNPVLDASGSELKSLDRYYVQRSDYVRGAVPDFSTIAQIVPPETLAREAAEEEQKSLGDAAKDAEKKSADGTATGQSKASTAGMFGIKPTQNQKLTAPLTYLDNSVQPGKRYDYRVLGVTEGGVKGRSDLILRVTFAGQASRMENVAVSTTK